MKNPSKKLVTLAVKAAKAANLNDTAQMAFQIQFEEEFPDRDITTDPIADAITYGGFENGGHTVSRLKEIIAHDY